MDRDRCGYRWLIRSWTVNSACHNHSLFCQKLCQIFRDIMCPFVLSNMFAYRYAHGFQIRHYQNFGATYAPNNRHTIFVDGYFTREILLRMKVDFLDTFSCHGNQFSCINANLSYHPSLSLIRSSDRHDTVTKKKSRKTSAADNSFHNCFNIHFDSKCRIHHLSGIKQYLNCKKFIKNQSIMQWKDH